jgi:hypothetical protein
MKLKCFSRNLPRYVATGVDPLQRRIARIERWEDWQRRVQAQQHCFLWSRITVAKAYPARVPGQESIAYIRQASTGDSGRSGVPEKERP